MMFYDLSLPQYETDRQEAKNNPICDESTYNIPSIICEVCATWAASGARIRKDFCEDVLLPFKGITFLPRTEWFAKRPEWAHQLNVDIGKIEPAASLGIPSVKILGPAENDFLHPFPGLVYVKERVAEVFTDAQFSGVDLFPCVTYWAKSVKNQETSPPKLWELVITGKAWRVGVTPDLVVACELCGRRKFPKTKMWIDQNRWDGSDFFNIDENPNIIIVTEKVADFLQKHKFSNYNLQALPVE